MVLRENQIAERLVYIVTDGLAVMGLSGVSVLSGHQPTPKGDRDPYILVTRVGSNRKGWQGTHLSPSSRTPGDMAVKEEWSYIEDVTYQISGVKRRNVIDDGSPTAADIVGAVLTYLMSDTGIAACIRRGLHQYRVGELRLPVSPDESEIPQFNPNFDITFCVHQTVDLAVPSMDFAGVETHPV